MAQACVSPPRTVRHTTRGGLARAMLLLICSFIARLDVSAQSTIQTLCLAGQGLLLFYLFLFLFSQSRDLQASLIERGLRCFSFRVLREKSGGGGGGWGGWWWGGQVVFALSLGYSAAEASLISCAEL